MLAQNIWVFLVFRLMQGAVICGAAMSVAALRDMVSTEKAASLLGYMALAMVLAPMLGPMLGGILDQVFGWRASFAFFAMSGAILSTLVWGDLGETNKYRSATFIQQFRTYPELLGSRRFWGYALCMAFSTGAFYVFIAGAPLVEMAMFSMSPVVLGFFIGAMSVRPQLAGSALGWAGALTVVSGAILTGLVSVLVTPKTGALALFGLMLAALSVMQADRRGVPLD
jgi:DHA1 family bicyclomycin/chloramphenicol resistance-like MFS transporter